MRDGTWQWRRTGEERDEPRAEPQEEGLLEIMIRRNEGKVREKVRNSTELSFEKDPCQVFPRQRDGDSAAFFSLKGPLSHVLLHSLELDFIFPLIPDRSQCLSPFNHRPIRRSEILPQNTVGL